MTSEKPQILLDSITPQTIAAIPMFDTMTTLRCLFVNRTELAVDGGISIAGMRCKKSLRTIEVVRPLRVVLLTGNVED